MSQHLTWAEDAIFEFKGPEFGQLHNALQAIVATSLFQEQLLIAKQTTAIGQLYELTSKKLQEGVEKGTVTEVPKEEEKPMD